jgi:hypothetical protein
MKWSITKSKIFSHCQRKWYYSEIMASSRSKDHLRREAYQLKQLQSLQAWRGSVVDKVIEKFVIPRVKTKNLPSENEVVDFCGRLMADQIAFGKARMHQRSNVTKSNGGNAYCALFDLEYNGEINEEKLVEAKEEAIVALHNLFQSGLLKNIMEKSSYIIAQRPLAFRLDKFTVSCTPDLVVFYCNAQPLIVDWKVHSFGNVDSWLQLGVYAVALSRMGPHKDFPIDIHNKVKDITRIRMLEYQLLKNEQREHFVSHEDEADILDYIYRSCTEIAGVVDGKKYDALDVGQFQTARSPRFCERCQFKKLCWKKPLTTQRLLFEGELS